MSRAFRPCVGKNACQDDGILCRTCGRSALEIETTRRLIQELAETAIAYGYDNAEEFFAYVASKAEKKRRYMLEQQAEAVS